MHSGHNVSAACLALFCVHVFFFRYFFLKKSNKLSGQCVHYCGAACMLASHSAVQHMQRPAGPAQCGAEQGLAWMDAAQIKGRHHSHLKNMPLLLCFLWMQLCCTALPCLYPSLPIAIKEMDSSTFFHTNGIEWMLNCCWSCIHAGTPALCGLICTLFVPNYRLFWQI